MRAHSFIPTLVLGAVVGTSFVPALAQNGPRDNGRTHGLTLHEVHLKLDQMGYRELTKISREHDRLRIKATDAQGRRVDVDVDPVTGDVRDTEVRRGRGDHADADQASWLTLHQVQVKLEAMGYRDIEEIDREPDHFHAKATDAQGRRVRLAVAPRSGDVEGSAVRHGTRSTSRVSD
ncbi:MAG: PepSY domain-containing protein [Burkholderiaceae bacterium]|jgi:hypothetical protein|nr:PepSY domain-containing protein [Burkholderiaceae bacterium]